MEKNGQKRFVFSPPRLIILSLGFGALFWVVESAAHILLFKDDNFFHQIYSPHPHEIWMRFIVVVLFIFFGIYSQLIVSARRKAEEAEKAANIELAQIFETSADGMRVIDRDFIIQRANKTFLELAGVDLEAAIGQKCYDVFHGPLCRTGDCPLVRIMSGRQRVEMESVKVKRDGRQVHCIITATPFTNTHGEIIGIVEDFKDITDRKHYEKELMQSREQLRELASHLENIRERERGHIARELHDELGQVLTAVKLEVYWLFRRIPRSETKLIEKAADILSLIDRTMQFVKKISGELRPSLLDDFGLLAAMEWQVREFEKHTGIVCEIHSDRDQFALDPSASVAVFRILQETLTNISRHAEADSVQIRIAQKDGNVRLEVRDNGKGMTTGKPAPQNSFGLIGIRERAAYLGGSMEIQSIENQGTTVSVSIPLEKG